MYFNKICVILTKIHRLKSSLSHHFDGEEGKGSRVGRKQLRPIVKKKKKTTHTTLLAVPATGLMQRYLVFLAFRSEILLLRRVFIFFLTTNNIHTTSLVPIVNDFSGFSGIGFLTRRCVRNIIFLISRLFAI